MEPVRIFVGTPANNEDLEAQAVLSYSLRKHTTELLDITFMMLSRDPSSFWYSDPQKKLGWRTDGWATPFSALRWGIPAACDFKGRAIYMDSDMIAMADIAELWKQPIPPGKMVLAKREGDGKNIATCVMLWDCAAAKAGLPNVAKLVGIPGAYRDIRHTLGDLAGEFIGDWNCRDRQDLPKYGSVHDPRIKILHYTEIPTQPSHKHARARLQREGKGHWATQPDRPHPFPEVNKLFDQLLGEAIAAGVGPETFRVSPEFGDYARKAA